MMNNKTRDKTIAFVVQGMELWQKEVNRDKSAYSSSHWLESISIDQIAERVVDNIISALDQTGNSNQLSNLKCPEPLSVDDTAQGLVDAIILLLEDRADYDDLTDEQVAILAKDLFNSITSKGLEKLKEEIV